MTHAQMMAKKALIADALCRAFEPPPPESDLGQGWGCAAKLVMFACLQRVMVWTPPDGICVPRWRC